MTEGLSFLSSARFPQLTPRIWRRIKEISLGYVLLAPALLLLVVFEFFPLFFGLFISMCDWKLACVKVIWFDNYIRAFSDPKLWHSLMITASYSIISVPLQLSLGLFLAYLLFQKIRGLQLYRMLYFMPYITTTVASAAVWAYLYSPDLGLINGIIRSIGLQPLRWLGETKGILEMFFTGLGMKIPEWAGGPSLALVSLIIYTTWVFVGYDIVIFLAGLGNIPNELYEAARVDGAHGYELFRYITFPLISPTSFFLLIITVIGTFKAFNHIYIMTMGGPGDATTTSSIFIFRELVSFGRYSYSAALSFVVFIIILLLTVFQNKFAGRHVIYE